MDPQPTWLHNGVIRRFSLLSCPLGDLLSAAVLGSAMQSQKTDVGAEDALFPDPGQGQELSQIHLLTLARRSPICFVNGWVPDYTPAR